MTFQDPLENYDPKAYNDALEHAICESPVSEIQHKPYTTISADEGVATALDRLAKDHIACLMVEENGKLVGVFTNREVLHKVALADNALQLAVRDVMTPNPVRVRDDDPIAAALCVMAVHGYRHVPIVGPDETIQGIVSPQRVTNFLSTRVDGSSSGA